MYLIFDVETNGLPKSFDAPPEEFPRVIQLAFQLYDEQRNLVDEFCQLIKPDGWEIPDEEFWFDNGYSTEKNLAEGMLIVQAMDRLLDAIGRARYRIAHNISFDSKVIRGELLRLNNPIEFPANKICTMMKSTKFCAIPSERGFKWPKLQELHKKLFDTQFDSAHDALADVKATAKCFFELLDRKVIVL